MRPGRNNVLPWRRLVDDRYRLAVAPPRSLIFRVKKQLNDLLRRVTGYQFVKAEELDALKAAAKRARRAAARRRGEPTG